MEITETKSESVSVNRQREWKCELRGEVDPAHYEEVVKKTLRTGYFDSDDTVSDNWWCVEIECPDDFFTATVGMCSIPVYAGNRHFTVLIETRGPMYWEEQLAHITTGLDAALKERRFCVDIGRWPEFWDAIQPTLKWGGDFCDVNTMSSETLSSIWAPIYERVKLGAFEFSQRELRFIAVGLMVSASWAIMRTWHSFKTCSCYELPKLTLCEPEESYKYDIFSVADFGTLLVRTTCGDCLTTSIGGWDLNKIMQSSNILVPTRRFDHSLWELQGKEEDEKKAQEAKEAKEPEKKKEEHEEEEEEQPSSPAVPRESSDDEEEVTANWQIGSLVQKMRDGFGIRGNKPLISHSCKITGCFGKCVRCGSCATKVNGHFDAINGTYAGCPLFFESELLGKKATEKTKTSCCERKPQKRIYSAANMNAVKKIQVEQLGAAFWDSKTQAVISFLWLSPLLLVIPGLWFQYFITTIFLSTAYCGGFRVLSKSSRFGQWLHVKFGRHFLGALFWISRHISTIFYTLMWVTAGAWLMHTIIERRRRKRLAKTESKKSELMAEKVFGSFTMIGLHWLVGVCLGVVAIDRAFRVLEYWVNRIEAGRELDESEPHPQDFKYVKSNHENAAIEEAGNVVQEAVEKHGERVENIFKYLCIIFRGTKDWTEFASKLRNIKMSKWDWLLVGSTGVFLGALIYFVVSYSWRTYSSRAKQEGRRFRVRNRDGVWVEYDDDQTRWDADRKMRVRIERDGDDWRDKDYGRSHKNYNPERDTYSGWEKGKAKKWHYDARVEEARADMKQLADIFSSDLKRTDSVKYVQEGKSFASCVESTNFLADSLVRVGYMNEHNVFQHLTTGCFVENNTIVFPRHVYTNNFSSGKKAYIHIDGVDFPIKLKGLCNTVDLCVYHRPSQVKKEHKGLKLGPTGDNLREGVDRIFFSTFCKPDTLDDNSVYGFYSLVLAKEGNLFAIEGITRAGDCGSPYVHVETATVAGFHCMGSPDGDVHKVPWQWAAAITQEVVDLVKEVAKAHSVGATIQAPKPVQSSVVAVPETSKPVKVPAVAAPKTDKPVTEQSSVKHEAARCKRCKSGLSDQERKEIESNGGVSHIRAMAIHKRYVQAQSRPNILSEVETTLKRKLTTEERSKVCEGLNITETFLEGMVSGAGQVTAAIIIGILLNAVVPKPTQPVESEKVAESKDDEKMATPAPNVLAPQPTTVEPVVGNGRAQ